MFVLSFDRTRLKTCARTTPEATTYNVEYASKFTTLSNTIIRNIIGDNAKIFRKVIIIKSWIIITLFSNKSSKIAPRLISLSSFANCFDFLKIKLCSPQNFRNSEDGMLFGLGCASLGSKIVTFDFSSSCSTLTSIIYLPVFNLHRTGCILLAFSKPEISFDCFTKNFMFFC